MRQEPCQRRVSATRILEPAPNDSEPDPESQAKSRHPGTSETLGELKQLMFVLAVLIMCYVLIAPKAYGFMGHYYLRFDQPASALAAYERVLCIWPRLFNSDEAVLHASNLLMARLVYWKTRYADAQARLDSLADSLADRANAHYHLNVEVSKAVYSWDDATIDAREELIAHSADNATVLASFGAMVAALAAEAEPTVLAALALHGTAACEAAVDVKRNCHNLGALLFDLGRYEAASRLLVYPHVVGYAAPAAPTPTAPALAPQVHRLLAHRFAQLERFMPIGGAEFATAAEIGGVLAAATCAAFVAAAESHASEHSGWSRGRHQQYPTTDLPLSHLDLSKPAVAAVSRALRDAVLPAFARAFPSLAGLGLYVDDAFVAKYGEAGGAQRQLNFHSDGTPLSFICTLAPPSAGGGTLFRAAMPIGEVGGIHSGDSTAGHSGAELDAHAVTSSSALALAPRRGDCLIFAGGALLHGGVPVTAGVRYLLIGFVGVGRGGSTSTGRYDAYRDRWATAKRADARLHDEHDHRADENEPPSLSNASISVRT